MGEVWVLGCLVRVLVLWSFTALELELELGRDDDRLFVAGLE